MNKKCCHSNQKMVAEKDYLFFVGYSPVLQQKKMTFISQKKIDKRDYFWGILPCEFML